MTANTFELALTSALNGVKEVGLAASVDLAPSEDRRLCVAPRINNRLLMDWCYEKSVGELAVANVMATMAFAVRTGVLWGGPASDAYKAHVTEDPAALKEGAMRYPNFSEEVLRAVVANEGRMRAALTMLFATKVLWWKSNHHTGQGSPAQYVTKVAQALFPELFDDTAAEETRAAFWNVVHTAGHWVSTAAFLKAYVARDPGSQMAMGGTCDPATDDLDISRWPTISDDLRLRVQSSPAGTAPLFVCREVVRKWVRGMMAPLMPVDIRAFATTTAAAADEVLANPIAYHISSGKFSATARATRVNVAVDEEVISSCRSYCEVVIPGSTLAKSPTLARFDADEDLKAVLAGVRREILKDSSAMGKQLALVKIHMMATGASHSDLSSVYAALSVQAPAGNVNAMEAYQLAADIGRSLEEYDRLGLLKDLLAIVTDTTVLDKREAARALIVAAAQSPPRHRAETERAPGGQLVP
ncbi:hypothetical protein [Wenzhou qinvirus-like virus 2]|uniref:Uncharacterized protein n=1 Tax=Wenzhou qinvirus-like virus 2 TaxID=1923648 RepID=A0A1L3KKY7_9VIRU|nr:hypothetical protein [Wenzhou qinvirus-like virus 2]APG78078.1 hypothetical protein [Wenzhou qinvirus-like virus 2]